ncbi:MAG: hypothetical protein KGY99_06065 [Phycisphaerae bacterium]|nr:hypothetical protein [Phycisphaerae bacterium]
MERLTLPAQSRSPVVRCRPARVYVGGRRRRDLVVRSMERRAAPDFGHARIALQPSVGQVRPGRLESLGMMPPVGAEIIIRPGGASGGVDFHGVVAAHVADIGAETLEADARHVLVDLLSARIAGRWQRDGQHHPVEAPQAPCAFNDGRNASPEVYEVNGRTTRVFAAGDDAVAWTVADALAYLLAATGPVGVTVPGTDELDRLTGEVDLGRLDVSGLPAAEALARAAERGGLTLRAARDGVGLVFYQPGRQGRRVCVRQQRYADNVDPTRSTLWTASVRLTRRPARRPVLAIGDYKRYETTVTLRPGWPPSDATDRWRDVTRGLSDDWTRRANVFRRWVLNEHDRYSGPPWSLTRHDFSDLGTEFFLPVPRRFEPCLSTDARGNSLGVVVEWRVYGGTWQRWAGPAYASRDECSIYLGGDALPAAYFQAAVAGTAEVRATATIASDVRLTAQIAGDAHQRREIIERPEQGQWRHVHSTSVFSGASGLGQPHERDDTERLRCLARRHGEALAGACDAELTLARLDTSYAVGDRIRRIDGRALELAGAADRDPAVVAVRHTWGDEHTTTLILEG